MEKNNNAVRAYALKVDEGWVYRFGTDFTVKVSELQQGSGAAVMEYVTRKGEEPDSHTHPTENEMFYVLEGALTFKCGEETFDLEKGGFIFLPHGIEHGYTVRSEGPVRLLVITSLVREGKTGGWGGFVADLESGQGELVESPED
jgi:quercetin dioxygenase-like cupin family protein